MSMTTVDFIISMIVMISIVAVYGVYMYKTGVKYGQDHTIVEFCKENEIIKEE